MQGITEMVDQPPQATPAPTAPVKPAAHASAGKKKGAEIVMIVVIVAFVGAGLMMIPSVRQAIFGGGSVAVPGLAMPGKPILEKPRNGAPMNEYTQYFGPRKSFLIEENGAQRYQYYYLVKPQKMVAGEKYPIVVFLHDEKGMAEGAVHLMNLRSKLPPFFLLVPQAPGTKTWAVPDKFTGQEIGKAKTAAQWTSKKFPEERQTMKDVLVLVSRMLPPVLPIDDERLYAVGCGEGGIGVYGALAKYSEFFAGGLVVSGLWNFGDAPKMTRTPLIIFHGAKDKVTDVVAAQGMAQVLKQLGGTVTYRELPDLDRNCADPRQYSAGALGWLFGQRRARPVALAPSEEGLQPAGYLGEMAPPSPGPATPRTRP